MKQICAGLLWVPFDYGIVLVKGRPGARFAPKKIKQCFFRLIKNKKKIEKTNIRDYGNVIPVNKNVKKTHEKVTAAIKEILRDGVIPIVIGGGHDISFGSGKAMYQVYKKVGQINIDAHYDVRSVENGKITSGTPFRRLLDGKFISGNNFVEMGVHSPRCLPEHYRYLMRNRATVMKLDSINKMGIEQALKKAFNVASKGANAVMFDIDIDGIQSRFAPGCSAPGVKGFTKNQALKTAYFAGKNKNVKLFNLMEVSPVYDVNNKTVKLAAELILNFIKGLSER